MKHLATSSFWETFEKLPKEIQNLAKKNFEMLKENSTHPSLRFKKIGNLWSVRVGRNYRALGLDKENIIVWFWIGKHEDYEKLIH